MINFFHKHRNTITNVLLISLAIVILLDVVIIILNLTYLNTSQLELIVTFITGITTIIILFWALNESRKNNKYMMHQNKIMMAQSIYEGFVNEINTLNEKGKTAVYSERYLSILRAKSLLDVENITYQNYFYIIDVFLMAIADNEYYRKYFRLLSNAKSVFVEKNDAKEIQNLIALMNVLYDGYRIMTRWQLEVSYLYDSIVDSEFLLKQQKTQLFSLLDRKCGDFISYCRQAEECESEEIENEFTNYYKVVKFAKKISTSEVQIGSSNIQITKREVLLSNAMKYYRKILEHKTKLSNIKE